MKLRRGRGAKKGHFSSMDCCHHIIVVLNVAHNLHIYENSVTPEPQIFLLSLFVM